MILIPLGMLPVCAISVLLNFDMVLIMPLSSFRRVVHRVRR
jgi:hypothetical protein